MEPSKVKLVRSVNDNFNDYLVYEIQKYYKMYLSVDDVNALVDKIVDCGKNIIKKQLKKDHCRDLLRFSIYYIIMMEDFENHTWQDLINYASGNYSSTYKRFREEEELQYKLFPNLVLYEWDQYTIMKKEFEDLYTKIISTHKTYEKGVYSLIETIVVKFIKENPYSIERYEDVEFIAKWREKDRKRPPLELYSDNIYLPKKDFRPSYENNINKNIINLYSYNADPGLPGVVNGVAYFLEKNGVTFGFTNDKTSENPNGKTIHTKIYNKLDKLYNYNQGKIEYYDLEDVCLALNITPNELLLDDVNRYIVKEWNSITDVIEVFKEENLKTDFTHRLVSDTITGSSIYVKYSYKEKNKLKYITVNMNLNRNDIPKSFEFETYKEAYDCFIRIIEDGRTDLRDLWDKLQIESARKKDLVDIKHILNYKPKLYYQLLKIGRRQ